MEENNLDNQSQGDKQSKLLFIIILIVLVVSAIWFISQKPTSAPAEDSQTTVQPTTAVAATSAPAAMASATEFSIEGGSFYFEPNEIKVKVGQKVKITLNSVGGMPHDFIIDELNVKSEQVTDTSTVVEFTPDQTGEFEFYCSVGKHRQMGMVGTLIVE